MGENLIINCGIESTDDGLEIKLEDGLKKEKGENWRDTYKHNVPPNVMDIDKDKKTALVRVSLERRDNNE